MIDQAHLDMNGAPGYDATVYSNRLTGFFTATCTVMHVWNWTLDRQPNILDFERLILGILYVFVWDYAFHASNRRMAAHAGFAYSRMISHTSFCNTLFLSRMIVVFHISPFLTYRQYRTSAGWL